MGLDKEDKVLVEVNNEKKRRRPHTKSRGGCQTCKKVRIKCDEVRPQCGYCKAHCRECIYSVVIMPEESRELGNMSEMSDLNLRDLQLLYHYQSNMAPLLAFLSPQCEEVWTTSIPQLALKMNSVIHNLLAISAAHRLEFLPKFTTGSSQVQSKEFDSLRWLRTSHFEAASNAFQHFVMTFNSEQEHDSTSSSGLIVTVNSILFLIAAIFGLSDVPVVRDQNPGSDNDIFTTANNTIQVLNSNSDLETLGSDLQPLIDMIRSTSAFSKQTLSSESSASTPTLSSPLQEYEAVPLFNFFYEFCINRTNECLSESDEESPQKFRLSIDDSQIYTTTLKLIQSLLWHGWYTKNYLCLINFFSSVSLEFIGFLRQYRPMALIIILHFNAALAQCTIGLRSARYGIVLSGKLKHLLTQQWHSLTTWTDSYININSELDKDRFHSDYLQMLQASAPPIYYESI